MVKKGKSSGKRNIERTLQEILRSKYAPSGVYIALVLIYIATNVIVNAVASSRGTIELFGGEIPKTSFAGVFASLSNIMIIFMVVYYEKKGYITSLVLMLVQTPIWLLGIIKRHNIASLPGIFTTFLTIIAITIIYINNVNMDKIQEKLRDQAITDGLTGLPNRFACTEFVNDLIKRGERFTFVSIDINNFKSINDTMGRDAGNKVLIEVSERWKNIADNDITGTIDFITRQGGDEFSLIIRRYKSNEDVMSTIRSYESALVNKVTVDECDFFINASFGYAEFPTDAKDSDALFSCSDAAMYEVKRANSSEHIMRFKPEFLSMEHTIEIERDIRNALDTDTMFFCLQPQFDISHKLRGFEVLARMKSVSGNNLPPSEFIPVAEKVGLIDKVDSNVFRKAAMFFGELIKNTGTDVMLSVNVSVRHLMKNDFLEEVSEIIKASGVPAEQIEIEITESIMIDSADKALMCINDIKSMGIKIAIDDFGTGYSSLSYLNKFPADLLKVDKSFIDKMNSSESSKKYVAAIISIGHIMNFGVISEGVEDQEQLDTLSSIGCDYIQGYIWGKPLPPEEAKQLVIADIQSGK